jgi:myo-inositol-1(or 4)-monophosphatase
VSLDRVSRKNELEARVAVLDAVATGAWAMVRTALKDPEPFAVEVKAGPSDLVTPVDRAVEERVRDWVLAIFPEDAFAGEEFGTANPDGLWRWWVDPIDGTTNFAHRVPFASISIGLARGSTFEAGAIVHAFTGEVFSAVRRAGARHDDRLLRLGSGRGLGGAVVATELLGSRPWPGLDRLTADLDAAGATLRILGSTALTLAYAAAGAIEAVVLAQPNVLDAGAGLLLVEEAGGRVEHVAGGSSRLPFVQALRALLV